MTDAILGREEAGGGTACGEDVVCSGKVEAEEEEEAEGGRKTSNMDDVVVAAAAEAWKGGRFAKAVWMADSGRVFISAQKK